MNYVTCCSSLPVSQIKIISSVFRLLLYLFPICIKLLFQLSFMKMSSKHTVNRWNTPSPYHTLFFNRELRCFQEFCLFHQQLLNRSHWGEAVPEWLRCGWRCSYPEDRSSSPTGGWLFFKLSPCGRRKPTCFCYEPYTMDIELRSKFRTVLRVTDFWCCWQSCAHFCAVQVLRHLHIMLSNFMRVSWFSVHLHFLLLPDITRC